MTSSNHKIGIIVPCWDTLRRDPPAFDALVETARERAGGGGIIFLSLNPTAATPVIVRDRLPLSFVADRGIMSPARLARLCDEVFDYNGQGLIPRALRPPAQPSSPRFGLVVSNGFGLGHVTRMKTFAEGLKEFGPVGFMSFSGGLWRNVFYLPSEQYLELHKAEGHIYTREAAHGFFNDFNPTHVFYDGNVLPPGLLSLLAARPDVHLTWIRRGMWQPDVAARFMAQQALADLVIEPGDISETYDTGPSWKQRLDYCPPAGFLKTPPVRPGSLDEELLVREKALSILGFDAGKRYALLMLGACQKAEDLSVVTQAVAAVRRIDGLVPVIAHWPMSHDEPPQVEGALTIEKMPISPYYRAFDIIISAAGYNSYHEILALGLPAIFVPQEDEGRDQQRARAQYAADRSWAPLCSRERLAALTDLIPVILERPQRRPEQGRWLEDWTTVARALEIDSKAENPEIYQPAASAWTTRDLKRMFKTMHKRWRRKAKPYKTRLVLALDMDYESFARRIGKSPDRTAAIIVTNSIDPIALRRGGYKYAWLNTAVLKSPWSMRRQVLAWLKVWRPEKIVSL